MTAIVFVEVTMELKNDLILKRMSLIEMKSFSSEKTDEDIQERSQMDSMHFSLGQIHD